MKNTDIENFLKQYIDANNHPGYGILISGEWGVGKTHFLKKIIESV
ncbi:P-loop NTPase fold protein, partial [Citrobacter koseri]